MHTSYIYNYIYKLQPCLDYPDTLAPKLRRPNSKSTNHGNHQKMISSTQDSQWRVIGCTARMEGDKLHMHQKTRKGVYESQVTTCEWGSMQRPMSTEAFSWDTDTLDTLGYSSEQIFYVWKSRFFLFVAQKIKKYGHMCSVGMNNCRHYQSMFRVPLYLSVQTDVDTRKASQPSFKLISKFSAHKIL